MKMQVTYFYRKPIPSFHFSMEKLFNTLKEHLASRAQIEIKVVPHFCEGNGHKYKNILWARQQNTSINHVVGDIHYVGLGLAGKNTVVTIHDINFLKRRNILKSAKPYFLSLLLPIMKAKIVTVVSEQTKKEVLRIIPFFKKKIRVIPNFYDPAYIPSPKTFNSVKPKLLQLGTSANKNVTRLIEAIEGIECQLSLVGRHSPEIEQLLKAKGIDYEWESNITDAEVLNKYRECDILCFVSTVEGFGMPILEAQGVGRAVITSTTSSMPEVARDSALLVNPYSVQEIREGIIELITNNDLREKLIQRGFENINRYKLETIAKMYLDVYAEIEEGLKK
jgi:glycosyltransferase involved in cell wall biosynthesis